MTATRPLRLSSARTFFRLCKPPAWTVAVLASALSGCSYSLPAPACPPSSLQPQNTVRLVVSFRQSTAGDAPQVLQQLQAYSRACVSYVSSVSSTVHVYTFAGGGDADTLTANLRAWPAVLAIVADQKALPQKVR